MTSPREMAGAGARASRRAWAAVLVAGALALLVPLDGGRAQAQAVPTRDGPVVLEADPFTTGAARGAPLGPGQIELTTVSTRPALVTGGDVRVAVRGVLPDDRLTVARDGEDVTGAFAPATSRPGVAPGAWEGVVRGIVDGPNVLVAAVEGAQAGRRTATLVVTGHPISGPIISGPHQEPFVCQTEQAGMGPPLDADCFAPTQVRWYARDAVGQFAPLADPYAPYPAGTATTLAGGQLVPFVVRIESAVINRGIARIAVLDDPAARGPDAPYAPAASWNHRLVYHFGESCGTGFHQGSNDETDPLGSLLSISGSNLAGPLLDLAGRLGDGYMVAESTLTIFGVHCNQVLSAETLAMVKEHIVDAYGDVDHVISGGASGGAIQQYTIADQYPGLLDAGVPILSFPDVMSTAMTVYSCVVLQPVFDSDPNRWTIVKQRAITGLATPSVCKDWVDLFGDNLDPRNCPGGIPPDQRYDPDTNPSGVRCDLPADLVNIVGRDPATGLPNRPIDDAGVQYGWQALQAGLISPQDFVDLNAATGGRDTDDRATPARVAMSDDAAASAFRYGFLTGRGALDQTPIIDLAVPVVDVVPVVDIHDQIRAFEVRARMDAAYGGHASQSIWTVVPHPGSAVTTADQWLDALDARQAADPTADRAALVAEAKPLLAGDQCRLGVVGVPVACDQGVLRSSSPRQAAGGPLREDVIKCARRPVDAALYPPTMLPAQLDAVRQVFPGGVCDWSQPSVGFTARSATWTSFGADQLADPTYVPYTLVRSAPSGDGRTDAAALAGASGAATATPRTLPATGGPEGAGWLGALLLAAVVARRGVARRVR